MKGGEIFIPKCPSYKIMDIAKSINSKAKIDFIEIIRLVKNYMKN